MASYASQKAGKRSASNSGAQQVLASAASSPTTGTANAVDFGNTYANWAFQLVTGSTKADIWELEASLDGTNWGTLAGSTFTVSGTLPSGGIVYVSGAAAQYIRATLNTRASGTSQSFTAYVAGA